MQDKFMKRIRIDDPELLKQNTVFEAIWGSMDIFDKHTYILITGNSGKKINFILFDYLTETRNWIISTNCTASLTKSVYIEPILVARDNRFQRDYRMFQLNKNDTEKLIKVLLDKSKLCGIYP
jgi:hypothetical protein